MTVEGNLLPPFTLEHDGASAHAAREPMDRLAPELLAEIFWLFCTTYNAMSDAFGEKVKNKDWRHVYPGAGTVQYQRNLGTLRQVSRHWYNIIESTPQLWAVISAFDPIEVTEKALLKSGDNALVIRGSFDDDDILEATEFANSISRHIRRWERASLVIPTNLELAWLETPALRLRAFRLERATGLLARSSDVGDRINLFQAEAPLLDSIRVSWIPVDLNSSIFNHLKDMSLTGIRISMAQLLAALVIDLNIEKIRLSGLVFEDPSHQTVDHINLPHLLTLELGNLGPLIVQELLVHIKAPRCRRVILLHIGHHEGAILSTWFMHHLRSCFPALLEAPFKEIRVIYVHTNFVVTASEQTGEDVDIGNIYPEVASTCAFAVNLQNNQAELQIVPWLADLCESATLRLTLVGAGQDIPGMDEAYLASIPNTQSLTLSAIFPSPYFLEVLSRPATVGNKEVWLLPRLEELIIDVHGPLTREGVLALVSARYADNAGLGSPAPLKRLQIWGLPGADNRAVYEKLRDLVGVDALKWDNPYGLRAWAAEWEAERKPTEEEQEQMAALVVKTSEEEEAGL